MTKPFIICSAVIYRGTVVCGRRHSDAVNTLEALITSEEVLDMDYKALERGFVDNYGRFHNREEAWKIASEARQIRFGANTQAPDVKKELISEHLFNNWEDEPENEDCITCGYWFAKASGHL